MKTIDENMFKKWEYNLFIPAILLFECRVILASAPYEGSSYDFGKIVFVVQVYDHERAWNINFNCIKNNQFIFKVYNFMHCSIYRAFLVDSFSWSSCCFCFLSFNSVSRWCNPFVVQIVLNSSCHLSSISFLNFSSNFFTLNVVFDVFKTSFRLATNLSLCVKREEKGTTNTKINEN